MSAHSLVSTWSVRRSAACTASYACRSPGVRSRSCRFSIAWSSTPRSATYSARPFGPISTYAVCDDRIAAAAVRASSAAISRGVSDWSMAADVSVIRAIDHHETATISTIITTTQPKPAPSFQASDAATRFRTHASG